ncbi:MAG: exodeoxyribonuclease VII small subunit [Chlorobaculum sp.]
MPASSKSRKSAAPTIEELIQRLEEVTRNIENPDTGLENSIALYEEGMSVAEECRKRLLETRKKLETINPAEAARPAKPESAPESPRMNDLFGTES